MEGPPPIVLMIGFETESSDDAPWRVLEEAGLWVEHAASWGTAIQDIAELQPDAIVIAHVMTAAASAAAETARIIRALKRATGTRRAALIMVDSQKSATARDLGMLDARLANPSPSQLREAIERALAGSWAAPREVDADSRPPIPLGPSQPLERVHTAPEKVSADSRTRRCPDCQRPLVWTERSALGGIEYDYFRWCEAGCGLYCFAVTTGEPLKLV